MNKKPGLFFFLKKSKINVNGLVPIYLRITIAGLRTDISSRRFIDPAKWNNLSQNVTGTSEEAIPQISFNGSIKQMIFH